MYTSVSSIREDRLLHKTFFFRKYGNFQNIQLRFSHPERGNASVFVMCNHLSSSDKKKQTFSATILVYKMRESPLKS